MSYWKVFGVVLGITVGILAGATAFTGLIMALEWMAGGGDLGKIAAATIGVLLIVAVTSAVVWATER